jgi:hypothetical protein
MSENNQQTTVSEVDIDIDALFAGAPGADSITLPNDEEKKPSLFSNEKLDTSFLDNTDSKGSSDESTEEEETADDIISDLDNEAAGEEEEEEVKKKAGRPRKDSVGISEVFSKLIEDELLIPFDDEKPLEEYSAADWKELIEANFKEVENKVKSETPKEFFESLPEELQYAAQYVMNGGSDLKGLFRALSTVEEYRELDPRNEGDQEVIVREYLVATGFGNTEDIDEEIQNWKDLGRLEQQANKFKPKLDKMQEEVIGQKLAQQEQLQQQQQRASEQYMENVYNALKPGEINGIKLDKKTQSQLYAGLVQPNYPSISGKSTNLLGHLLEKYQFVEPNYSLISEALWLLSDPDGYRNKIMDVGKTKAVESTVRQLKTEQSKRMSSSVADEKETKPSRKISRPANIFKRF